MPLVHHLMTFICQKCLLDKEFTTTLNSLPVLVGILHRLERSLVVRVVHLQRDSYITSKLRLGGGLVQKKDNGIVVCKGGLKNL